MVSARVISHLFISCFRFVRFFTRKEKKKNLLISNFIFFRKFSISNCYNSRRTDVIGGSHDISRVPDSSWKGTDSNCIIYLGKFSFLTLTALIILTQYYLLNKIDILLEINYAIIRIIQKLNNVFEQE